MNIEVISSGSKGNAYLVYSGRNVLLLDCGVKLADIRRRVNLSRITACFVTHRHKDHARSVMDLCSSGVNVYALPDVLEDAGVGHHPYAHPVHPLISETGKVRRTINIDEAFEAVPFMLEHDVPNIGWWICSNYSQDSLLYFTDTAYVKYRFPRVNYLLAECNHCTDILRRNVAEGKLDMQLAARIKRSHMSLESLLAMLDANDLDYLTQIRLIHLSDQNSDEARILKAVREKTGCEVIIA